MYRKVEAVEQSDSLTSDSLSHEYEPVVCFRKLTLLLTLRLRRTVTSDGGFFISCRVIWTIENVFAFGSRVSDLL